jgi:hypothetical protein
LIINTIIVIIIVFGRKGAEWKWENIILVRHHHHQSSSLSLSIIVAVINNYYHYSSNHKQLYTLTIYKYYIIFKHLKETFLCLVPNIKKLHFPSFNLPSLRAAVLSAVWSVILSQLGVTSNFRRPPLGPVARVEGPSGSPGAGLMTLPSQSTQL